MIDFIVLAVSWILMVIGGVFVVSGAIGLVRMPDLYTRLHAASLTDTGGTMVIGLALIIQALFVFDNTMAAVKMGLIVLFTLFTSPTASHALSKTALLSGHVPVDGAGKPLLDSSEEATQLARSRPADYKHGEDANRVARELEDFQQNSGDKS